MNAEIGWSELESLAKKGAEDSTALVKYGELSLRDKFTKDEPVFVGSGMGVVVRIMVSEHGVADLRSGEVKEDVGEAINFTFIKPDERAHDMGHLGTAALVMGNDGKSGDITANFHKNELSANEKEAVKILTQVVFQKLGIETLNLGEEVVERDAWLSSNEQMLASYSGRLGSLVQDVD